MVSSVTRVGIDTRSTQQRLSTGEPGKISYRPTPRGWGLVIAGVTAGLFSYILGDPDLLRVTFFLLAITPGALILAAVLFHRLLRASKVSRAAIAFADPTLQPGDLGCGTVGSSVMCGLTLTSPVRRGGRVVAVIDRAPAALGGAQRSWVRLASPQIELNRRALARARGVHSLGPVTMSGSDPAGLVTISRSFPASGKVVITPHIYPLETHDESLLGGGATEQQSVTAWSIDAELAATLRPYRSGDDLRAVHWPSTARAGELVVRGTETHRPRSALIVLDTRAHTHRGKGPNSSLEWGVDAAASISHHLMTAGYQVQLASSRGLVASSSPDRTAIIEALTAATASTDRRLSPDLAETARRGDYALVVALMGGDTAGGKEARKEIAWLASFKQVATIGVAFFIQPSKLESAGAAVSRPLTEQGWRVRFVSRGESVTEAWTSLPSVSELSPESAPAAPRAAPSNAGADR